MAKKYVVDYTKNFKKQYIKMKKRGKDLNKLHDVIEKLLTGKKLDAKYKNHKLVNDKNFVDCMECHIEPDWLLIYKVVDTELVLLLLQTGTHSDLFKK